jgi:hypothetical protein
MTYALVIEQDAFAQLRRAARWYAERSQSQEVAERWYTGFLEALRALEEDPRRFALARESHRFPTNSGSCSMAAGARRPIARCSGSGGTASK